MALGYFHLPVHFRHKLYVTFVAEEPRASCIIKPTLFSVEPPTGIDDPDVPMECASNVGVATNRPEGKLTVKLFEIYIPPH